MGLLDEIDQGLKTTSYRHVWEAAGYRPLPHQKVFHSSTFPFRALIGGLGAGKSIAGAAEITKLALMYPGSRHMVCAPTYSMMRKSTAVDLRRFLYAVPGVLEYDNKSDNELRLTNGSTIWIVSLEDPDKQARGPNCSFVWLDEAALVSEYAYQLMTGRARLPGFPTGVIVTTTPRGFNWVYKYFVKMPSEDPEAAKEYFYVRAPTKANIYLGDKYDARQRRQFSEQDAKQELEGEFVGFSGQVYPNFKMDVHVGDYKQRRDFKEYYYWHDFGYTNPMVCLAVGIDGDGRAYVLEEWYITQKTPNELIAERTRMQKDYAYGIGIADPAEPGIIEDLNRAGLPTQAADNSLVHGIQLVRARLDVQGDGKPRLFVDRSCVNVIREFHNYRYDELEDGKINKDRPLKMEDHSLDAIRYGCAYLDARGGNWSLLNNSEMDRYF